MVTKGTDAGHQGLHLGCCPKEDLCLIAPFPGSGWLP